MPLDHYVTLGRSGLRVSPFCLGCMTFGEEWGFGSNVEDSEQILDRFLDAGGNFLDTANVYTKGHSEKIIGDHIGKDPAKRDRLVIATKFLGNLYPGDPNGGGAHRKAIFNACEQSLRRLNTDYIDLYYLHAFDEDAPLKETLETLNDFVRQGKIRYIGVSNFAAWQVMKALSIAEQQHYESIACIQPMYNLLKRQCESEILPMAASEKLGVLPYSPIGGGYLSGKYLDAKSVDGRLATSETYQKRYADESNRKATEQFMSFAQKQNIHPASLAIAWVASHPVVTAPIIGARNIDQLRTALDSLDIEMSGDMRRKISGFSREPALPTDRTEEQPEQRANWTPTK